MRAPLRTGAAGLAAVAAVALAPAAARAQEPPGRALYDRWCAECHGAEGRGDGSAAAWMLPRPRDFTQARFQIRTTPSGALPTDADLQRILEHGMPGTAMPAWPRLSRTQRDQVIAYIKTFSPFFESEEPTPPIEAGRAPRGGEEAVAEGQQLYEQLECWKCHGQAGRGDGTSAPTQKDDNNWPIRPANLSQNWLFNGGGSVADIYMRLRTGLDGTPMPSFAEMLDAGLLSEGQLWNVAHYVRSLSPEKAPGPREVIPVARVATSLPDAPDAEAWQQAEAVFVPLVGQIIARPRWFAPTVTGVWVQGLHDDSELALKLSWDDPSRSPDAAWEPWRARLTQVMEPKEGDAAAAGLPDAFAVQFPTQRPERGDLPYFLMGDASKPVYLWTWSSADGAGEQLARGIGRRDPLPAEQGNELRAGASFADGRWQLVLRRRLATADTANRLALETGVPIPIAFFAWDGSSGEEGSRGAISSWYFLHLGRPVAASIYITPVVAAVLTALLAIGTAVRAQRRHRGDAPDGPTSPSVPTTHGV